MIVDHLVILDSQVPQVSREHQVSLVRLDNEAVRELQDLLGGVVSLVARAIQVQLVLLAFQGRAVVRDRPDSQELLVLTVLLAIPGSLA